MKLGVPRARPVRPRAAPIRRRVAQYFNERKLLKYIIYCGLGGFLAGYLLITILFFPGFGRSAIVNVPDVRGKSASAARRALERAGLELQMGPALGNPRIRAGRVLSQVPLPGQEASRGSTVRIFLSAGPDKRPVPSVKGMGKDDAISLLQRMGFQVRLRSVQNADDEEGTLLGMDPPAGTQLAMPGVVILTLSAGPPKVVVPSVLATTAGDAAARLQAAGLHLGRVSYDPDSDAPLGDIVAQSPEAGDSLRMGGGVRVTVSGVDPTPPAPAPVDSAAEVPADSAAAPPGEPEPAPPPKGRG